MSETLAKMGSFKVSHVVGEKGGKEYDFYSFERSYKNKQTDKWETQSITLRPLEMIVAAEVLKMAFAGEMTAQTRKMNLGSAASAGDSFVSDDVPF